MFCTNSQSRDTLTECINFVIKVCAIAFLNYVVRVHFVVGVSARKARQLDLELSHDLWLVGTRAELDYYKLSLYFKEMLYTNL